MSGGAFDYNFCHVSAYLGSFEDEEIERIVEDVQGLMKSLEWYRSGDTSHAEYLEDINEFKQRWLDGGRHGGSI